MPTESCSLVTPLDRPDYRELIWPVAAEAWPEFMHHDPIANRHWDDLYQRFPGYQFALLDAGGQPAAVGNSVPLAWDGRLVDLPEDGWDWALAQSIADHAAGRTPRTQCAIQISVRPQLQGQGLSSRMIQAMRAIGQRQDLPRLIAPVRPSLKSSYPLTNIDHYVHWQRPDGLPLDPWLRVHVRAGATLVKVCHQAMRITGSIAEWQEWTGMVFPESGPYVIPGALNPVLMDVQADLGTYVEPNVWLVHHLAD